MCYMYLQVIQINIIIIITRKSVTLCPNPYSLKSECKSLTLSSNPESLTLSHKSPTLNPNHN